jgi:Domain of unknown function (DUF4189)
MTRLLALAAAVMLAAALPRSASAEGRDFVEQRWGAIAAALWRDRNGTARVASGASWNQSSQNDAISVALDSCRNQGGQGCKIIGNTFTGCGYISIGNTRTSVRYGTGESPAAALDQCRQGGFRCANPVGGCSN